MTVLPAHIIFRDKSVDGVYSSPDHDPLKSDIREYLAWIESAVMAGTLSGPWESSVSALNAKLNYAAGNPGFVYEGSGFGTYRKSGASGSGSWVKILDTIPGYQVVKATNAGAGTANAIVATSAPPVSYSDGMQIIGLNITTTNTSEDVTVNFNGLGALAIRTASNSKPAVGGLVAPVRIWGQVDQAGTVFRMMSDQASAAVLTGAESAAAAASNWADLAAAWAEGTEPGGPGTKSAEEWAAVAEAATLFTPVSARGTINAGVGPYDATVEIGSVGNLFLKIGGVLQDTNTYTISGTEFTLNNAGGLSGVEWEARVLSGVREVGVPSDGSVGPDQLQAGAVGTDILADEAVTADKTNLPSLRSGLDELSSIFNVLDYGASTTNTYAQNKTALQAAISACDAAGGGIVLVPPGIDYGNIPENDASHPSFSGVVNDMMVEDYSPSALGFATEGAKQGWQKKIWLHTPPTTPQGQHNGNGYIIHGDWHPYYGVNNDTPLIAPESQPAGYNLRASYYMFLRGKAIYQLQMGNGDAGDTEETHRGLNWICYSEDGSFRHAIMSFDYGTGRAAYGLLTKQASSNHHFKMQDSSASMALFESISATNVIYMKNTVDADVYLQQTSGGFGIVKAGVGAFMSWDSSRHATTGGNLTVSGALSKTSGTFDIPHPDPAKSETHRLRHSFVESPTRGDNIYRFTVEADPSESRASIEIPLPDYWPHLNENPQVWISGDGHFGAAFGKVKEGGTAIVMTYDGTPGTYNVLLIGTRCDAIAKANFDPLGIEYIVKERSSQ